MPHSCYSRDKKQPFKSFSLVLSILNSRVSKCFQEYLFTQSASNSRKLSPYIPFEINISWYFPQLLGFRISWQRKAACGWIFGWNHQLVLAINPQPILQHGSCISLWTVTQHLFLIWLWYWACFSVCIEQLIYKWFGVWDVCSKSNILTWMCVWIHLATRDLSQFC